VTDEVHAARLETIEQLELVGAMAPWNRLRRFETRSD
jgi:hypothetical protein